MTLLEGSMWASMFDFGVSPAEKIIRTILVYAGILLIVRLFGKRLMAQMNSLDLVVVLLISNVVQNSIIGDDNSISGGLLGAVVLVVFNWALDRAEHRFPRFRHLVEGRPTTLVEDGRVHSDRLVALGITPHELSLALRTQGADDVAEVKRARLEPGGEIMVDLARDAQTADYGDLVREVEALRRHLDARLDALGAPAAGVAGASAATHARLPLASDAGERGQHD